MLFAPRTGELRVRLHGDGRVHLIIIVYLFILNDQEEEGTEQTRRFWAFLALLRVLDMTDR